MKEKIISAAIIAVGIIVLGLCIKGGFDNFTNKDRKVTVKGLAEKEVKADKVTWPIVSKELGNDLPELYIRIGQKQRTIKNFLLANGIKEGEISINAPKVIDLSAEQYSDNNRPYRYNVTLVITVTSNKVDQVRSIIARQGELLKQGVAIVAGDYENPISYEYVSFRKMKPKMMEEAIANAEKTAQQFATNSHSTLNKIVNADQGQFSIDNRDNNTPYIKKVRVVTTVTYSLKD
ncbi:MAG: SIMPL domain-containing protein [Prevotella sp.]|nr:SIMPL domain-containing protein [Prevotella sp.]